MHSNNTVIHRSLESNKYSYLSNEACFFNKVEWYQTTCKSLIVVVAGGGGVGMWQKNEFLLITALDHSRKQMERIEIILTWTS